MIEVISKLLKQPKTVVIQCRTLCFSKFKCSLSGQENTYNGRFKEEQEAIGNKIPDTHHSEIPDTRLLKVAVIGMPNAGKSTLINSLMDRKVCAASSRVHTTRCKAKAIFTQDDAQIVFLDTPGLVSDREQKKFNLEKAFLRDYKSVTRDADMICVIHDVHTKYPLDRLDIKVINLLENNNSKPSFLVLNKVDMLTHKRKLLDLVRQLTESCLRGKPIIGSKPVKNPEAKGWPNFEEIFMISALTGDGVEDIRNYLLRNAKPGAWLFSDEVWTDQSANDLILRTVKAKLLDYMPQEIPYNLKPIIEYMKVLEDEGKICIGLTIQCPKERIANLVRGHSDGKLRQITASIQEDLQEAFQSHVRLIIDTKFPKG